MKRIKLFFIFSILFLLSFSCKRKLGDPCEKDDQCMKGLVCLKGVCFELKNEGEDCNEDAECVTGLICLNGKCFIPRKEGEDCADTSQCVKGLTCVKSKCFKLRNAGEECADNEECVSGLVCFKGKCFAYKKLDETCSETEECEGNLICKDGKCVQGKTKGETCTSNDECERNLICFLEKCELKEEAMRIIETAKETLQVYEPLMNECDPFIKKVGGEIEIGKLKLNKAENENFTKIISSFNNLFNDNNLFKDLTIKAFESVFQKKLEKPENVNFCNENLRKQILNEIKKIAEISL